MFRKLNHQSSFRIYRASEFFDDHIVSIEKSTYQTLLFLQEPANLDVPDRSSHYQDRLTKRTAEYLSSARCNILHKSFLFHWKIHISNVKVLLPKQIYIINIFRTILYSLDTKWPHCQSSSNSTDYPNSTFSPFFDSTINCTKISSSSVLCNRIPPSNL